MKSKSHLLFITNIINPYQLDLFQELTSYYELSVIYFSKTEKDRFWNLPSDSKNYYSLILNHGFLNYLMQKISHDLYFQLSLIPYLVRFSGSSVVISGNYYSPNTWLALFILRLRCKKVYWMGDQIKTRIPIIKKLLKKIFLWPFFLFQNGILAVGHIAVKSYRDYGYLGPIICVTHSVNNKRFDRKLKTSNKILRVVMPASLIYRKGIDIGLRAFEKILIKGVQNCELRVIGSGPLMSSFIVAYQDHPNIKFLGFKEPEDVDQELISADIFLFCTRYDSWGVVVNEAISAGLPIIVSDRCGASELIDKQGGIICESENVDAFADALVTLIDNPRLRESMSNYHLNKRHQYSSKTMARKIFKFIS
jgi:glycosyltransferase involved in cell wall biosynthesis